MAFVFSGAELLDMVIMTVATGYIFMDFFKAQPTGDPVQDMRRSVSKKDKFLYSAALVAPAIILHELGHKFVGMAFGHTAVFNAAYTWLGIGVVLKLIGSPFIIMVPAYVRIIGQSTPLESLLIAFAGPGVNALVWIGAWLVLRTQDLSQTASRFWRYTLYVNGFLFVFNLIPFPGFDGFTFFRSLGTVLGIF